MFLQGSGGASCRLGLCRVLGGGEGSSPGAHSSRALRTGEGHRGRVSELPGYLEATNPTFSTDGETGAQSGSRTNLSLARRGRGKTAWTHPFPGKTNPSSPTPQGNPWAS